MSEIRKSQSHGRIGEAAAYAKCWMYGIPAYLTGGLRANFAGSDLIVDTVDPRRKLLIQVKTGAPILRDHVYLTQCAGEDDIKGAKFAADFVIFINLDTRIAKTHSHEGKLGFEHLSFYVIPGPDANELYRKALGHWAEKPKRDGGRRKLSNMAVHIPVSEVREYKDAWSLVRRHVVNKAKHW